MALCIPSGLGADWITSVVFVDEDITVPIGNLTKRTQKQRGLKSATPVPLVIQSASSSQQV